MNCQNHESPARGSSVMQMRRWSILLLGVLLFGGASVVQAQTPPPALFFTDLAVATNTGNGDTTFSTGNGAYVTLYGNYFGTSQGTSTITWNGQSCLKVLPATGSYTGWGMSWLWYQKIIVQVTSSCTPGVGNIVVTTSSGTSNGLLLTVTKTGNIYCISTAGSDSNTGKFPNSCWATLQQAVNTMVAGDTVYLENGVLNTATPNYSAVVVLQNNGGGTAASPIAMVGYPGATATIGDYNNSPYAVRTIAAATYYVMAELTLRGQEAFDPNYGADHWWVVGNDASCSGSSGYGCFHPNTSTNLFVHGNNVHDNGYQCTSNSATCKLNHGMYFTTNTNHVWVGWNLVDNNPGNASVAGCRGILFYSTGGADMYDLHVHDNIIRNTICDGLSFGQVNPNNGTVEAYNNVIYHTGTGPDPSGSPANYVCLSVQTSGSPTVPALIYNNSMYDCGSRGIDSYGAFLFEIPTTATNNAVYMLSSPSEPYMAGGSAACSSFGGSNNDWYGNGSPPCTSNITKSLNSNPQYTYTTLGSINLFPQAGSPLFGAGVPMAGLALDIAGTPRPNPPSIGTFDSFSVSSVQRPNPPTNLTVVVN